jgi:diguanylate cyclase (GGDEF)-like protein
MHKPKTPRNEAERLHALRTLKILDTDQEERFDRVTRMAKRMFGVNISLVSLVDEDRQWFKSKQGLEASETPRDISFCGHAINQNELFIIPDTFEDERFYDNPLVTGLLNIRFYAGYPLQIKEGLNIGTLCLIDSEPQHLENEDQQLLKDLGAMVEQEIRSIQMATIDDLTLISNRRGLSALSEHTLKVCRRKNMMASLILFDLNKFKPINDEYGHDEGDYALTQFADVMRDVFRESDVIGRLGGDEFVVMLGDTTPVQTQSALLRFDHALKAKNREINKPYNIEYSAGVSVTPPDEEKSLEQMLAEADKAMYDRKKR